MFKRGFSPLKTSLLKKNSNGYPALFYPHDLIQLKGGRQKKRWVHVLNARRIANKVILCAALLQIIIFGSLAFMVAQWHLSVMFVQCTLSSNIFEYGLHLAPGLLAIPSFTSLMVWPVFIVVGSFKSHVSQELDTIGPHLSLVRSFQAALYGRLLDNDFEKECQAFIEATGKTIPNDIKWLIIDKLATIHFHSRVAALAPLLWKSKLRYHNEPVWARVMVFWSLFSGIHESSNIPTHFPIAFNGLWLLVISRDGFLITFGCLIRYALIVWITK